MNMQQLYWRQITVIISIYFISSINWKFSWIEWKKNEIYWLAARPLTLHFKDFQSFPFRMGHSAGRRNFISSPLGAVHLSFLLRSTNSLHELIAAQGRTRQIHSLSILHFHSWSCCCCLLFHRGALRPQPPLTRSKREQHNSIHSSEESGVAFSVQWKQINSSISLCWREMELIVSFPRGAALPVNSSFFSSISSF